LINKSKTKSSDAKKTKKEHPIIRLGEDLSGKLIEFQKQKKIKKEADSLMKEAEAPIIQFCSDQQDKDGFSDKFSTSYKVMGEIKDKKGNVTDTVSTSFISADSFSVSDEEEVQDELKKILGDEHESVIEEETSIVLKAEVFEDEKLQEELVEALGDKFDQFFDTFSKLKVAKGFNEKVFRISSPASIQQLRTLIVRKKPSLR